GTMSITIAPTEVEIESQRRRGGSNGGSRGGDWGGDEEYRDSNPQNFPTSPQSYHLCMLLALASILMLFVALSSVYVMREGESQGWRPIVMSSLLLPNTLVLLLSSCTLELARNALKRNGTSSFRRWLTLSTLLGLGFLVGQLEVWRTLVAQGIYLGSNPHSSFFYLLTGAHGAHLIGGVLALGCLMIRAWRPTSKTTSTSTALGVVALYWHFMDGLWIYLLLLLFVWR